MPDSRFSCLRYPTFSAETRTMKETGCHLRIFLLYHCGNIRAPCVRGQVVESLSSEKDTTYRLKVTEVFGGFRQATAVILVKGISMLAGQGTQLSVFSLRVGGRSLPSPWVQLPLSHRYSICKCVLDSFGTSATEGVFRSRCEPKSRDQSPPFFLDCSSREPESEKCSYTVGKAHPDVLSKDSRPSLRYGRLPS